MARRISSAQWWRQVGEQFKVLADLVRKAQDVERQELREAGAEHACGHQWEITIRSSLHSSGIVGEGPKSHRDADWWDSHPPVTVRAHNLRDALLVAATLPIAEWFDEQTEGGDS